MPSSTRSASLAGIGAGLIALAALVASATLLGSGTPSPARAAHDPAAAEALVAAYRRSRTAAYTVESTFHRRLRSGQEFAMATRVVQRPPDRLTIGETSIDGELGGTRVGCTRPDGGDWQCRKGGPVDGAATVAADVTVLRGLVAGARGERAYDVARRGDCFHLTLVVMAAAPPYGREATMCFDARTGALARIEVRRTRSVDRTTAIRLSEAVDPADLLLPGPFQGG